MTILNCEYEYQLQITCLTYLLVICNRYSKCPALVVQDGQVPHWPATGRQLQRLSALLRDWGARRSCTREELESLIGHLSHACKVVHSGRAFLHRMLDLLHAVYRPPYSADPSDWFRADLAWWRLFLERWNGVSHQATCRQWR